jgi:uncharacterized metal-binding protein
MNITSLTVTIGRLLGLTYLLYLYHLIIILFYVIVAIVWAIENTLLESGLWQPTHQETTQVYEFWPDLLKEWI